MQHEAGVLTAWKRVIGRQIPTHLAMVERLADRGATKLSEVFKKVEEIVPGKPPFHELLLGKTGDATTQILCFLENDPSFKAPLPNGVLEMVLNVGLQPVGDAGIKSQPKSPVFRVARVLESAAADKVQLPDGVKR